MYVWESYVEGPRWAGFKTAIKEAVIQFRAKGWDITLDYVNVDKGWIRETTFFKISSSQQEAIEYFQKTMLDALRKYNG